MPFGFGFGEMVLILVIVVVVFGATKLPELGEGLGDSIERFRERQHRLQRHRRFRLLLRRTSSRNWKPIDWILVGAAIAAMAAAMLTFVVSGSAR